MNKARKIIILSLFLMAACSKPEKIVATVDGFQITQTDLQHALNIEKENYDPLLLKVKENAANFKLALLNKLVQETILINEAKKAGLKLTTTEEEGIKTSTNHDDYWLERQKKKLLINKLINVKIGEQIEISSKDISLYYNSHRQDFFQPEQFRARQIIVDDRQLAVDILQKISKGENFAELAKKYSLSPDAEQGGDLGFFDVQSFPPVFTRICEQLDINEVSEVVKTDYGYQIFQLLGRREERQKSLDEVSKNIEFLLKEKQGQKVFSQWFADLQKQANVQINQEVLKEVEID
ncbi:MAG: peptidylprolyl isomerase [Pseudomonadota bacterium]